MKWMMWAALVLLGAFVGWQVIRYWQRNQELIPSAFRETVESDESLAQAS